MPDVKYVNLEKDSNPSKEPSKEIAAEADQFLKSISSDTHLDPQNLGRISSVNQRSKGIIRTHQEAMRYPIRDTTPNYPEYEASKEQLDQEFSDLMMADQEPALPDDSIFKNLQLRADGRPVLFSERAMEIPVYDSTPVCKLPIWSMPLSIVSKFIMVNAIG